MMNDTVCIACIYNPNPPKKTSCSLWLCACECRSEWSTWAPRSPGESRTRSKGRERRPRGPRWGFGYCSQSTPRECPPNLTWLLHDKSFLTVSHTEMKQPFSVSVWMLFWHCPPWSQVLLETKVTRGALLKKVPKNLTPCIHECVLMYSCVRY